MLEFINLQKKSASEKQFISLNYEYLQKISNYFSKILLKSQQSIHEHKKYETRVDLIKI